MYFTDCHCNHDFRTIYVWKAIELVLHKLYSNNNLSNWIYAMYICSYTTSLSIGESGTHCVIEGAFQYQLWNAFILSISIARIIFHLSGGILSHCVNTSQYVPTQSQTHVSKMLFCIPLYISASEVTWCQLPPAQLWNECLNGVAAGNKLSGVTILGLWDVEWGEMKLLFELSKKVFAFTSECERCRHIILSM